MYTFENTVEIDKTILPSTVVSVRKSTGLTQSMAAALVYKSLRAWQQYEGGERKMPLDTWELFLIKTKSYVIDTASALNADVGSSTQLHGGLKIKERSRLIKKRKGNK